MAKPYPWDRKPDETIRAHRAFTQYLELGEDRNHTKVAQARRTILPNIERWSRKHDWKARALAWDRHNSQVAQAARDKVIAADATEWQRRRQADLESIYQGGLKMRSRGLNMLDYPLTTRRTTERTESPDGKTIIEHITVKPANWTFATAGTLVSTSAAITTTAIDAALAEDDAFDPLSATPEECQAWLQKQYQRKQAAKESGGEK